jgi:cyanophycinase
MRLRFRASSSALLAPLVLLRRWRRADDLRTLRKSNFSATVLLGAPLYRDVMGRLRRLLGPLLLWVAVASSIAAQQPLVPEIGPANGRLVIAGGDIRDPDIFKRFVQLAGGPSAPIVVIPTNGESAEYDEYTAGLAPLRTAGATNLTVLHTRDRKVADTAEFVRPLLTARAVWITGGRPWRGVDAYLNTRVHRELQALLARGGVIGGSSGGATIQASYLLRGDTKSRSIIGDHQEGFGFLRSVAIDPHVLQGNRQFDLFEVVKAHPELLGIGIDQNTAIVVQGDTFDVVGQSYVAIYDGQSEWGAQGRFYLLREGDRYNMRTRTPLRPTMSSQSFEEEGVGFRKAKEDRGK